MRPCSQIFLAAVCLGACTFSYAETEQSRSSAEEVVTKFYEYLRASDVSSMEALFFRIPAMDSSEAEWLALIEKVAQKVEDEQLDWEVVCGKELSEMAAVIVNQTMKHGRKHADPDAVYLVRENDRWLLLPDIIADNARDAVRSALTSEQLGSRSSLRKWAVSEIRGITTECR